MSILDSKNKEMSSFVKIYILAAIIATILVYAFGFRYPFQFDDLANISKNFSIRKIDVCTQFMNNSRWLGELINRINFKIGEFDPFSYRIINLIIHLSSGLIALFFSLHLLSRKNLPTFVKENKYLISALTLILFLLHPVQTQTVSYVIQGRLEGLSTLFSLLSIFVFTIAIEQVNFSKKILYLLFAEILLFIGLCNKESSVVAPGLGILVDLFWISNFSWIKFRKNLWLHFCYLALPISFLLYFFKFTFLQKIFSFSAISNNNRGNILTNLATEKISAKLFLFSQFGVILHYLWMFFLPISLCIEYNFALPTSFFSTQAFFPFLILCFIGFFFFLNSKSNSLKIYSFGFFWFMLSVLPRSSIIPSPELACDYKTYLGSFGILFAISTLILFIFDKFINFIKNNSNGFHFSSSCALPIFILLGSTASFFRNKVWSNQVDFWQDIVSKNPKKARPLNNLGVALTEAGRYDEAICAYEKSAKIDRFYPDPLSNLAVVYSYKDRIGDAILVLERAIHILPDYPEGYNNLAAFLFKTNRLAEAEQLLNRAIQLRPFYGKAHYNLGRCLLERGESEQAWNSFKKATEGDLDTLEGFLVFGAISQQLNKHEAAVFAFEKALQKGDKTLETSFSLANSMYCLNNFSGAEGLYKKILNNINPDLRVVCNLGETLIAQEKFDDALKLYNKFLPNFEEFPQAMFRKVHCLEKTLGVDPALAFLEDNKMAKIPDEAKETLKNELGRLRLQKKINGGNCSLTGQEFQKLFNV